MVRVSIAPMCSKKIPSLPYKLHLYRKSLSFPFILIERPNANLALTHECALTCEQKLSTTHLATLAAGRKAKIKKKTPGGAGAQLSRKKSAVAAKIVKKGGGVSPILP
jgi:hypothetical protein